MKFEISRVTFFDEDAERTDKYMVCLDGEWLEIQLTLEELEELRYQLQLYIYCERIPCNEEKGGKV